MNHTLTKARKKLNSKRFSPFFVKQIFPRFSELFYLEIRVKKNGKKIISTEFINYATARDGDREEWVNWRQM